MADMPNHIKKRKSGFAPFALKKTEDEEHFLMECKRYHLKRNELFKKIEKDLKIDFLKMSPKEAFHLVICGGKSKVTRQRIAQFIWESMELRASLIAKIV